MKAEDFSKKVDEIVAMVKSETTLENIHPELRKKGINDVFNYAAWCEYNFEQNLRGDYERKTTFTSDFSIAEWFLPTEGVESLADTLKRALNEWKNSVEYFAELIIALNMKSWEHHARKNYELSKLYANLYYSVKDLYFDWFEGNSQVIDYYFQYVD